MHVRVDEEADRPRVDLLDGGDDFSVSGANWLSTISTPSGPASTPISTLLKSCWSRTAAAVDTKQSAKTHDSVFRVLIMRPSRPNGAGEIKKISWRDRTR